MYIKKGVNGDKLSTVKHGIGCEGDKKKEKGKKESSSQQCIKLFTGGRRGGGGREKKGRGTGRDKIATIIAIFYRNRVASLKITRALHKNSSKSIL